MDALQPEELAIRAHDIVVCMERTRSAEFETLSNLGVAVRLALHLRGAPATEFELLKKIAVHILSVAPAEVRPALELLAEAEFVILDTEGTRIKTVIPDVPYFDGLYAALGEVAVSTSLTEAEELTVGLVQRLAGAPMLREQAYDVGAEKKLVSRVLDIGLDGGFLVERRARGKNVILSPSYFAESEGAYADLVASKGVKRVNRVLDLLKRSQGWPLAKILSDKELGGSKLDTVDLAILNALAGDGFVAPPAIKTTHAGTNFFLFGPRPGSARLPLNKKSIYERAMALVAAVRQGQLLPDQYRIRSPVALLSALRDRGFIRASTESWEQYRQVAELRVGRLTPTAPGWAKLELIDKPENKEALDLAIDMVRGNDVKPSTDDQAVLALREGHRYVDSLLGRKHLVEEHVVALDPEAQDEIETLLLRGVA